MGKGASGVSSSSLEQYKLGGDKREVRRLSLVKLSAPPLTSNCNTRLLFDLEIAIIQTSGGALGINKESRPLSACPLPNLYFSREVLEAELPLVRDVANSKLATLAS